MLSLCLKQYTGEVGKKKLNLYIGKWVSTEAVWMCYHASDHTVGLTGHSYLYIGW